MAHKSTVGELLIATPAIGDGNFEQSVIFMLHHDGDGALGVIINEPSELAVAELLPRWADLSGEPAVIFDGGPVQKDGFIGVGRRIGEPGEGALVVPNSDVTTVDLDSDPALARARVDKLAPVPRLLRLGSAPARQRVGCRCLVYGRDRA